MKLIEEGTELKLDFTKLERASTTSPGILPVAIQQPLQPPGIHPDFNLGRRDTFHKVNHDELIIRGNECTRLAEHLTDDLRYTQGSKKARVLL